MREETVENVEEALLNLEGMDTEIASALAAHGITTRDALADLAGDELVELTGIAGRARAGADHEGARALVRGVPDAAPEATATAPVLGTQH